MILVLSDQNVVGLSIIHTKNLILETPNHKTFRADSFYSNQELCISMVKAQERVGVCGRPNDTTTDAFKTPAELVVFQAPATVVVGAAVARGKIIGAYRHHSTEELRETRAAVVVVLVLGDSSHARAEQMDW